ncbi:transcriptional regulator, MerR family [Pseudonocardia thermophila]|jgi:Predicted transcriptional regulators|uniref:Transcriptional regulator, MerR family n=1 Tax=Pseudonocardia thermophila TaxID=1848 RepID=A0A1M6VRR7_PSETH|nr:MerR family transcriptional regulator [Pseudonocardia thermophila]SHK84237.1 transcriptional regulator, MerR family [Pseudonocardia thermophila]
MRIGELAERTGVSQRSLRHYEQHGLLHSTRTANGWRDYDEPAVRRVRAITALLASGLNLADVARLSPCLDAVPGEPCADPEPARRTYAERLAALDRRITELHRRRAELARTMNALGET